MRRVTLHDVAREAGVSKSLVSVALRGEPGVSHARAQHIRDVAARLGYRSNALARSLVQGATGSVGVLMTDLRNPYHGDVAAGIQEAADEAGLGVLLGDGMRDRSRITRVIDTMLQMRLDMLIIVSSWADPIQLAHAAHEVPVVIVGRPAQRIGGADIIHNDDEHGARVAVDHLAALGHRRIAFVPSSERPSQEARRRGFLAGCEAAGVEPRVALATRGRVADAVMPLVENGVTAVMSGNDMGAIEVLQHAARTGLAVPRVLSLVGYDDTSIGASWSPALTSVAQPLQVMGRRALTLALSRADGREQDRYLVERPSLVTRETTAPPP